MYGRPHLSAKVGGRLEFRLETKCQRTLPSITAHPTPRKPCLSIVPYLPRNVLHTRRWALGTLDTCSERLNDGLRRHHPLRNAARRLPAGAYTYRWYVSLAHDYASQSGAAFATASCVTANATLSALTVMVSPALPVLRLAPSRLAAAKPQNCTPRCAHGIQNPCDCRTRTCRYQYTRTLALLLPTPYRELPPLLNL